MEEGKHGSVTYVLSAIEFLLEHLEAAMNKYKDHPESHFKVGVQCAWQKANGYYQKLDDSPVYLAAIALHPGFKWQYIENRWSTRMDWVNAGLKKVKDL